MILKHNSQQKLVKNQFISTNEKGCRKLLVDDEDLQNVSKQWKDSTLTYFLKGCLRF